MDGALNDLASDASATECTLVFSNLCVCMREHVLPAVRRAVDGRSAADVDVDILDKIRAGEDGDAVLVVRGLLSEGAAALHPNRRHLLDSTSVIAYRIQPNLLNCKGSS